MPLFPNPFRKRKNNDLPQNPAPTRIVTPIFGSESRPYASTDPAAPTPEAPAAPASDPYAPSAPASDPYAQSAPPAPDSAAKSAYVRVQEGDDNSAVLYPSPYARRSRPIDPDGTALPDARGIYRRPMTPAEPVFIAPDSPSIGAKRICGSLFSVSRTLDGELWPIYLGFNRLGSATDCPVRLEEKSVLPHHISLYAYISDSGRLSVSILPPDLPEDPTAVAACADRQFCHSGDIITIGDNYELLINLYDIDMIGLERSRNFAELHEVSDLHDSRRISEEFSPREIGDEANSRASVAPAHYRRRVGAGVNATVITPGARPAATLE